MRITNWRLHIHSTGKEMEFETLFDLYEYLKYSPDKFDGVRIDIITDMPATDEQLIELLEQERQVVLSRSIH